MPTPANTPVTLARPNYGSSSTPSPTQKSSMDSKPVSTATALLTLPPPAPSIRCSIEYPFEPVTPSTCPQAPSTPSDQAQLSPKSSRTATPPTASTIGGAPTLMANLVRSTLARHWTSSTGIWSNLPSPAPPTLAAPQGWTREALADLRAIGGPAVANLDLAGRTDTACPHFHVDRLTGSPWRRLGQTPATGPHSIYGGALTGEASFHWSGGTVKLQAISWLLLSRRPGQLRSPPNHRMCPA